MYTTMFGTWPPIVPSPPPPPHHHHIRIKTGPYPRRVIEAVGRTPGILQIQPWAPRAAFVKFQQGVGRLPSLPFLSRPSPSLLLENKKV